MRLLSVLFCCVAVVLLLSATAAVACDTPVAVGLGGYQSAQFYGGGQQFLNATPQFYGGNQQFLGGGQFYGADVGCQQPVGIPLGVGGGFYQAQPRGVFLGSPLLGGYRGLLGRGLGWGLGLGGFRGGGHWNGHHGGHHVPHVPPVVTP